MGSRIDIDNEFATKEYLSGKTLIEIGNSLGVSRDIVSRSLKESGITLRRSGRRRFDIKGGQKFGSLTIIEPCTLKSRHLQYICKCDCGEITKSTASDLTRGKSRCWTCRNKLISESRWRGFEEISGEFFEKIKTSAKIRMLDFEITIEQIWDLFLKQNRKCALSGVDIKFTRRKEHRSSMTASLDRIDSSKHYTINNIQWVHKIVNNIKMDLDEEDFIKWCELIYKNFKRKGVSHEEHI